MSDFWVHENDNTCYCHVAPSSNCLVPPNQKLNPNSDPNVGVYSIGYVCKECPAGTYQSEVGKFSCVECPAGKTSTPGSSVCIPSVQITSVGEGICTQDNSGVWLSGDKTYTRVGTGICQPTGIRMYHGDATDEDSTLNKIDRCGEACADMTRTPLTSSWAADGPANGFSVALNGRCYCNHENDGSVETCPTDYGYYHRYAFETTSS